MSWSSKSSRALMLWYPAAARHMSWSRPDALICVNSFTSASTQQIPVTKEHWKRRNACLLHIYCDLLRFFTTPMYYLKSLGPSYSHILLPFFPFMSWWPQHSILAQLRERGYNRPVAWSSSPFSRICVLNWECETLSSSKCREAALH